MCMHAHIRIRVKPLEIHKEYRWLLPKNEEKRDLSEPIQMELLAAMPPHEQRT